MSAIERFEVRMVAPPGEDVTWANKPPQFQGELIVRVWDQSGNEGVGATPVYSSAGYDLSILETVRMLVPRLIGEEALRPEARWRQLQDFIMPIKPEAIAAIDIAIWDLCARSVDQPLYRYLGGERERILSYASTPQFDDPSQYVEFVQELHAGGYRAVKFHSWNIPDRDLQMLQRVYAECESLGMLFMHDAEMMYDRRGAFRVGRALEEMGFYWYEAPLQDFDLDGYRELRERVTVPIIPAGNRVLDPFEFGRAVSSRVWDSARFDVTIAGGFTQSRMLSHLAHANGLSVEPQSWGYTLIQAANLHYSLAFEEHSLFEQTVPLEAYEFGVTNPFRIGEDGWVTAPTGGGLGVDVDWSVVDGATIASFVTS